MMPQNMNAQQATAWLHPCRDRETAGHPRYRRVRADVSVILTIDVDDDTREAFGKRPVWHGSVALLDQYGLVAIPRWTIDDHARAFTALVLSMAQVGEKGELYEQQTGRALHIRKPLSTAELYMFGAL